MNDQNENFTYNKSKAIFQIDISDSPKTFKKSLDIPFLCVVRDSPNVDSRAAHS